MALEKSSVEDVWSPRTSPVASLVSEENFHGCSGVSWKYLMRKRWWENALAVQWLGLHASTAGVLGSIFGRGTKDFLAVQPKK